MVKENKMTDRLDRLDRLVRRIALLNTCNKSQILFTNDVSQMSSRLDNSEKFRSFNFSNLEDPQYDKFGQEFFNILTDIRVNPEKYNKESKDYSLDLIFLKIKPSNEINYSEKNNKIIKKYIIDSHFKNRSISDQEKDLKNLLNKGSSDKVKDITLFQTFCTSNDMKENVWLFLEENEDEIEKIFSVEYNYLMIICLPLEYNTKILANLIFYKK
jgi:hypothetical protein